MDGVAGQVSAMVDRIRDMAQEDPERYEKLVKAGENFSVNFRGTTANISQID